MSISFSGQERYADTCTDSFGVFTRCFPVAVVWLSIFERAVRLSSQCLAFVRFVCTMIQVVNFVGKIII